jgi:hypothetical protein
MNALLYLQLTSLKGLIRSRLLRLKQPKYLAGAVVGAAYIYFFFIHRAGAGYGHPNLGQAVPVSSQVSPTVLWPLVLLALILLNWILPRATASLAFSEAEIAFLFPAPISRRTLVHYRLLGSQLALLFGSAVLALFSNRWTFLAGSAASHVLGWWLILSTLSLHSTASSFVITRLANRGVPAWSTRLVVLALVVAVIGLPLRQHGHAPASADLLSYQTVIAYLSSLSSLLTAAPLSWLLALPKFVLGPFLAPDWHTFALALPAALLVLGAHYVWTLLSVASFEEASVARAEKRAARIRARREGALRAGATALKARRARFRLAPTGRPETAFLWKNLLATPSFFSPRTAFIAAAAIVAGCTYLAAHPVYRALLPAVIGIALVTVMYAVVLGPQLLRYDLRADLLNADLLKTYPLRGWQIILGELLTPMAILTTIVWLALLAAALSVPPREGAWFSIEARAGTATALALLVPPICALRLLMPNALAVLLPAWALAVANRSEHGLDVLGQRIIFLGGQLVVTVLLLVPPALCAAAVFLVVYWVAGLVVAAMIACLVAMATLVAEVWIAIQWLGRLFERFDLSSELRA